MRSTILRMTTAAAFIAIPLAACGSGGSASSSSSSAATGTVVVHAKDALKFDKQSYDAKAGDVSIEYVNDGSLQHTLLIEGNSEFKLSVGSKDSGNVKLAAGTYTIYCDVAGHRGAGMEAKLVVS